MKRLILVFQIIFFSFVVNAQIEKTSALYQTIKAKDSLLFNLGFNNCDLSQFENLLSENFEFYHDQSGYVNSKTAFIDNVRLNICTLNYSPKRILIENSLEIFPLNQDGVLYGAIETGIHHFFALESDSSSHLTSTAKFSHVWILENGTWKLKRGLSYDHKDFSTTSINYDSLFIDVKTTENWIKEMNIPALGLGYINQGVIEELAVYGELEKGRKAPLNTIWNVASLTKPITALITLKLIDAGQLELDEELYTYYVDPDLAEDTRVKLLTPRNILSHQSGLPNNRTSSSDSTLKFEFEPGTQYQYSGEAYDFLRKAIEHKMNKSIEELAIELIFQPLDMHNTSYVWQDKFEGNIAKWHTSNGEIYPFIQQTDANGADDLLTTVEDYCKFMLYIMNGAEISEELQLEMTKNQVRIKDNKYFGLGWWIDEVINANNDFAMVHGGDDLGVHTIVFLLPKTQQGLLIFTNSDTGTQAYEKTLLQYLGENGKGIMKVEME